MGEFLLSLLELATNGDVVFKRHVKRTHFKAGDKVPLSTPNPNRITKHKYYRIFEKFYDPATIVELLKTQNPNVIDQNGFVPYQRQLQDADIYEKARVGLSPKQIAQEYGWHHLAVMEAIQRHQNRMANNIAEGTQQVSVTPAIYTPNPYEAPYDVDTTPLQTPSTTPEQRAVIDDLLAHWDDPVTEHQQT